MSRCTRSSLRCDDGSPIVDNTYDLPVAHERRQVIVTSLGSVHTYKG
jgi:hypothetical protein